MVSLTVTWHGLANAVGRVEGGWICRAQQGGGVEVDVAIDMCGHVKLVLAGMPAQCMTNCAPASTGPRASAMTVRKTTARAKL